MFRIIFFVLIFITASFSQRVVDLSKFKKAYFDSVRATVNDTTREHYIIHAYRLTSEDKIKIDGKLNEPAWKKAEHQGNFFEKEPYPLVPMSEQTEFAILYDTENLYVGVWCWDSEPGKIVQRLNPRGNPSSDNIQLFIDPYHDKRTGYKFSISPTGVQMDELRYDDYKRDYNWNGVWHSAASLDKKGWYAEVKIPFFNLRFRNLPEQTWGFNIMRNISKDGSRGQWKPHLPEWYAWTRMSTLGEIVGLRGLKTGRQFEIRPSAISGMTQTSGTSATSKLSYGLDIRYNPTPNITSDVTVNPDFAQVDADVLVINLSRFPTRFKELRPFFTERTNIFNTPYELFYSRRIGAAGDIIGGVKLTGKTASGFEYGALSCITGNSPFSNFQNEITQPETANFGVLRLKKDLFTSSSIGVLGAAKEEPGERYNRVLGVDASFNMYTKILLNLQVALGQAEGHQNKNLGFFASLENTGDLFGFTSSLGRIEPNFEINRIGFLRKEKNRGWNLGEINFRVSPRINSKGFRRIFFYQTLGITEDLLTDDYIDEWLDANPEKILDPYFGEVRTQSENAREILGGKRNPQNWTINESFDFLFMNETKLNISFGRYTKTELTGKYSGKKWIVSYATRPTTKGANFQGIFSLHGGEYYNFSQKYVGNRNSLDITGTGRFGRNIISRLQGEFTRTWDLADRRDGRYLQFSSHSTILFTKDLYFRFHFQGRFKKLFSDENETENQYLLSTLLSWEYRPGCFFYLAYNEGRSDLIDRFQSTRFNFNDRTLVLKLSYRFNI